MSVLRTDLARHQKQLDKLKRRAVILDAHGCAWQESRGCWYRAFDGEGISSFELAQNVGRVTVLTGAPEPDDSEEADRG